MGVRSEVGVDGWGEWEWGRVNPSTLLQESPGAGPLLVLIGQGNTLTARYRSG